MNKLHLPSVLILLASALIIGCSEEDSNKSPAQPSDPQVLFPVESMQTWIYDAERHVNDRLEYRGIDTTSFDTATIIWAGEYWYRYTNDIDPHYWRNGVDGVWRLWTGVSGMWTADKYFAYPALPGDVLRLDIDGLEVRVVAIGESVEVPVGTFEGCYLYSVAYPLGIRRSSVWIKPGIGVVQRSDEYIDNGDTTRYVAKLRQY